MDEQQKKMAEELLFSGKNTLSFGKRLFFGAFEPSFAFPYPILSKAEEESFSILLQKVKDFLKQEVDPDWIDRHAEIPPNVIEGLAKLGVLGMTVPKEWGGLGMSQLAYCKIVEVIAAHCASTALLINVHQSIGLRALLLFGTEEQKQKWLRRLAKGEILAAFSLTEPNAGSDASGIETRAVYDPEKKVYRINGKKQWTSCGGIAQLLTVMAKTEVDTPQGKQDKVTAFLVSPTMPGFEVTNYSLEKVGMKGTKTANLAFTDMEVPVENVLGKVGGGLRVCLTVLDYGRTTFGAMCTGAAKFLLEHAKTHAKNRYQFQKPLASFGLIQKKIAKIAAYTYAMDATTTLTAGLIDSDNEDIMIESAILKVFTSDALWSIIYETMQIYGGRSFFTDHPFERMMRDARLNMIGEGANEVMRTFIAAVGMRDVGMNLKSCLDGLKNPIKEHKTIWNVATRLLNQLRLPKVEVQSEALANEAKILAQSIRRFGIAVAKLLMYYREDVVDKQLELERISDSVSLIYTVTAVLSKLDAAYLSNKTTPQEIAAGKFYCQLAFQSFDNHLQSLFCSLDPSIETLSNLITGISTDER